MPAYPPDPARLNRTLKRFQSVVDSAQAKVAITSAEGQGTTVTITLPSA